jgi:flagellar FliJ protein
LKESVTSRDRGRLARPGSSAAAHARTAVERLKKRRTRAMNGIVGTPSFNFRLERVRSLRERAEEAAREELARELSHRVRGEALLRQATQAVESARSAGRPAVVSAADLVAGQAWMERLESRRVDAVAELGRRDDAVARSRAALTERAREREAIERIKRKRRADHDAEVLRQAQIALDEVALTVHRRGTAA